jgi:hypothetical protein
MKQTAIVKNISEKLLFEQTCELLDVIGYFETDQTCLGEWSDRIEKLLGILNILDEISDQLEREY